MSRQGVSNNKSKFVCYKCGETGHLSQNCMTPDTKCFSCGDSDHISTQCPQKIKGEVNKRVTTKRCCEVLEEGESRNQELSAFIDTGSSECTMKATHSGQNGRKRGQNQFFNYFFKIIITLFFVSSKSLLYFFNVLVQKNPIYKSYKYTKFMNIAGLLYNFGSLNQCHNCDFIHKVFTVPSY